MVYHLEGELNSKLNGNINILYTLKFHLEGGRETQEGRDMGDICICITDSLCYKAETNTPL